MNSQLEDSFLHFYHILAEPCGAPLPQREYRFEERRKWRADFAWPLSRLMVEIEGGTRRNGRHNRYAGYAADCMKYNAATLLGWRVLRYTGEMLADDPVFVIDQICKALGVSIEIQP